MTLIFAVFALGVAVSLVIAKGIMQANDFAKAELEKLEDSVQDDNPVFPALRSGHRLP